MSYAFCIYINCLRLSVIFQSRFELKSSYRIFSVPFVKPLMRNLKNELKNNQMSYAKYII